MSIGLGDSQLRYPFDHPKEECGVVGVYMPGHEASRLTFFGLFALQHRGQESAGIATSNGKSINVHSNMGLVTQIFREEDFYHQARWNVQEGRVEMHLVCAKSCVVSLGGEEIVFAPGESIHTENAYKYEMREFEALAREAGLVARDRWLDPGRRFSVQYFEVDPSV